MAKKVSDSQVAGIKAHAEAKNKATIDKVNKAIDKLKRKKLPITLEGLNQLNDIAGLRVVCHYINDIQYISQLFIMNEDIQLIKKENYIDYPKESGYRSLHLVVKVPIYLKTGVTYVPVEIQLRTISMDSWASLEHVLSYKSEQPIDIEIRERLKKCARKMAEVDLEMQKISQELKK